MKIVKVADIMTKNIISLPYISTLFNAATKMSEKKIGSVVVVKNEKPIGIITERDIVRLISKHEDFSKVLVNDVMSKPIKTISYDAHLSDAGDYMLEHNIRKLIVVKGKKVLGIITETDLLKGALLEESYLKSEKKESEEALKKQQKFSDLILSTISNGIDVVDENLNILYLNKKFLNIFGKKAIGKKCYEVYKDNKKQCEHCPLKSHINVGKTKTIIATGVVGKRIYEITYTGMMFEDKKAIMEVFKDITEQKKVEMEKERLNQELQNRIKELEKFQKLTVGRELKMIELKNKIKKLEENLSKNS